MAFPYLNEYYSASLGCIHHFWLQINYPKLSSLTCMHTHTHHTYDPMVSMGQVTRRGLAEFSAQALSQSCMQGVFWGLGLIWGSNGEGSTSMFMWALARFSSLQVTRMRPRPPAGCQWQAALSSLRRGLLHMVNYFIKASKGKSQDCWLGRWRLQVDVTWSQKWHPDPLVMFYGLEASQFPPIFRGRNYKVCRHQEMAIRGDHLRVYLPYSGTKERYH